MSNYKYISPGQNSRSQAANYEFQVAMLSKRSDDLCWHNVAEVESERRGRKQVHFAYANLDDCIEGCVYRQTSGRVFKAFFIFRDGQLLEITQEEANRVAEAYVAGRLVERQAARAIDEAQHLAYQAIDVNEETPLHDQVSAAGRAARPASTIDGDAWTSQVIQDGAKAELAAKLKAEQPEQWNKEEAILFKRREQALEAERRFQQNHDL